MSLSNQVENEMLTDFLTRHPVLYVALSTSNPGETGAGIAEPVGMSYVRQLVGDVTLTGSNITNDVEIAFPAATGNWGTLTYVALFDAESGGNYLGCGIIAPTACPAYTVVLILAGTTIMNMD